MNKFKRFLTKVLVWFKKFFTVDKKLLLGLIIVSILFILNILFTTLIPTSSVHKKVYGSGPYIVVLIIAYLLYLISYFTRKKKSVSDVMVVVFVFLGLWDVTYKVGWLNNDLLIPSPEGLFMVFKERPTEIRDDVISSLGLMFLGVLFASILGTLFGLLAGWMNRVRETALPIINVFTLIPPLMLAPYLIMTLPSLRIAAITVIFIAVFFPTFQGTVSRVGMMDKKIIEAAKVMNVGTFGMLFKVILPYCLPGIITSISKSLRGAFMCLQGAELLGLSSGIGYYISKYSTNINYRVVLSGIVVIAIVTTIIDLIVNKIEKTVIKWSY